MPADGQAAEITAEITALESRLAEARSSFAAPFGISAAALAALEHAVQPALEDARRRLSGMSVNTAGLELLGAGEFTEEIGAPRWKAMPLAARRSVLKAVFREIRLAVPGAYRLTGRPSDKDRMRAAAGRLKVAWR